MIASIVSLLACATPPAPVVLIPEPEPPRPEPARVAPQRAPAACTSITRIEIHKSQRSLVAHCEGGARQSFRVALGRRPIGPKRLSGDRRTPEGTYRVSGPARASRFHLFIPIDYPSLEDARQGLRLGTIGQATYQAIAAARDAGEPPPQDTPLGGAIGLHGEGDDWSGQSGLADWTFGCIALPDADIEYLAERVDPGTEVWIEP
jgi:murein L,D-transpeptidase YafK